MNFLGIGIPYIIGFAAGFLTMFWVAYPKKGKPEKEAPEKVDPENDRLPPAKSAMDFLETGYKYIGGVTTGLTSTKPSGEKSSFKVLIMFLMTDDGRRKISVSTEDKKVMDYIRSSTTDYNACLAWARGGPFPDNFKPEDDVLIGMLSKLVDKKLVGEEAVDGGTDGAPI